MTGLAIGWFGAMVTLTDIQLDQLFWLLVCVPVASVGFVLAVISLARGETPKWPAITAFALGLIPAGLFARMLF